MNPTLFHDPQLLDAQRKLTLGLVVVREIGDADQLIR